MSVSSSCEFVCHDVWGLSAGDGGTHGSVLVVGVWWLAFLGTGIWDAGLQKVVYRKTLDTTKE